MRSSELEPSDATLEKFPCACATLRRATRVVSQLYDDELRATGLRATQFALLQVIKLNPRATQTAIGATLAIDSTTLTRTLKLLKKAGLIDNSPGTDRRELHWFLTESGMEKLDVAYPLWEKAQKRLRKRLSGLDWDLLFLVAEKATHAAQNA